MTKDARSHNPWDVLPVQTTRQQSRRTYDRLSRWYSLTEGLLERPATGRGLSRAQVTAGERVLDIGCGPGWALQRLALAAGEAGAAVGLDLSLGMLAAARKSDTRRSTRLVQADALRLPFRPQAFDVVFMSFVLELLPTHELPSTLSEIFHVLRPQGRFVNVSLTREKPNMLTRAYEFGHRWLPSLLDCRPLYVARILDAVGARVVSAERVLLYGLPVEVTVARPALREPDRDGI